MALVINDGVVSNDAEAWVEYFVLNKELTGVYEITMPAGVLTGTLTDAYERNVPIVDSVTGIKYYLTVEEEIVSFDVFDSDLVGDLSTLNWKAV